MLAVRSLVGALVLRDLVGSVEDATHGELAVPFQCQFQARSSLLVTLPVAVNAVVVVDINARVVESSFGSISLNRSIAKKRPIAPGSRPIGFLQSFSIAVKKKLTPL